MLHFQKIFNEDVYYPNFFILMVFFLKCRLTYTSTLLNILNFVVVTCIYRSSQHFCITRIIKYWHNATQTSPKIDFICISICINIISRLLRQHLHLYLIIQLIHLINMNDIEKWKWNIKHIPRRWARSNSSSSMFFSL